MNRTTIAVLSISAGICFVGLTFAGNIPIMKMDTPATNPTAEPIDLKNTVCPVSGDKVGDSKLTETYDGKIYHLCCDDCPKAFKKDPAKYAKAVAADPSKYGIK
jgi:YHS domain-containing protein